MVEFRYTFSTHAWGLLSLIPKLSIEIISPFVIMTSWYENARICEEGSLVNTDPHHLQPTKTPNPFPQNSVGKQLCI